MLAPRVKIYSWQLWWSLSSTAGAVPGQHCSKLSSVLQGIQTLRGFWLKIWVTALRALTLTCLLTLKGDPVKLHVVALHWTTLRTKERRLPKGPKTCPLHRSTMGRALPNLTGLWRCWVFQFWVGFLKHLGVLGKSLKGNLRWSLTKRLGTISLILSVLKKNHWEACLLGVLMMGYSGDFIFVTLENLNASWLPEDPSRCKPNGSSQWRSLWFKV